MPQVGTDPTEDTAAGEAAKAAATAQTRVVNVPLLATTVSQAVFIADIAYTVQSVKVVPSVIGGAAATITVEVLTGVQAPGAGVAQLTAPLALNGVAHTVLPGTLITTPTAIAANSRVGIVMAGTLTGLVGVATIVLAAA